VVFNQNWERTDLAEAGLDRRRRYLVLAVCFQAWFMVILSRMVIPPVLPLLILEFRLSYTESGLIPTSLLFGYALVLFPAGWLADRMEKKRIIVPGLIFLAVTMFLTGISTGYHQLLFLQFLAGLGAGVYLTPANSLLSDVFSSGERGRAFGIHEAAVSLASLSAALIAVPLALAFNWRFPLFICSGLLIVTAILFSWLVKEPVQNARRSVEPKVGIQHAFTGWFLALSMSNALGVGFCYNALAAFMPTYLVNVFGVTLVYAAILVSVVYASGTLGRISCGPLSDRFGRGKVSVLLLTVTSISIFLFVMLCQPGLELVILLVVIGFALNGVIPVFFAFVADVSPIEVRGTRFGLMASLGVAAGAISGVVVGYVADTAGFVTSFVLLGLAEVVATLVFLRVRKVLGAAARD